MGKEREWRKLHNGELQNFYTHNRSDEIWKFESAGYVSTMEKVEKGGENTRINLKGRGVCRRDLIYPVQEGIIGYFLLIWH